MYVMLCYVMLCYVNLNSPVYSLMIANLKLIEVPPLRQGSVNCNALEAKRKENWHLLVVCMIDGVLC